MVARKQFMTENERNDLQRRIQALGISKKNNREMLMYYWSQLFSVRDIQKYINSCLVLDDSRQNELLESLKKRINVIHNNILFERNRYSDLLNEENRQKTKNEKQ